MNKLKSVLLATLIFTVFLLPGTARAAIDAEIIVTGKCSACHGLDRTKNASLTKDEWTSRIDKEINRGAQLTRGERRAVIDWLAANYGKTELAQSATPDKPQDQVVAQAENTNQSTQPLPFNQQAQTGVELWQFLLGGGALMGGGALLRRRKP